MVRGGGICYQKSISNQDSTLCDVLKRFSAIFCTLLQQCKLGITPLTSAEIQMVRSNISSVSGHWPTGVANRIIWNSKNFHFNCAHAYPLLAWETEQSVNGNTSYSRTSLSKTECLLSKELLLNSLQCSGCLKYFQTEVIWVLLLH